MMYHAAYTARRSMSQSVDPDAESLLEEKPQTPRQRSHAPSPFVSPRSLEQHAAHQKLQRLRNAPRRERESAPSVEPPRSHVPEKLRKAEEHLREERDAAVLAELFGEYGSDAGGEDTAWDEFQGRMAPPRFPLHKTRPHLDSQPVREQTADLEGAAEWPPVAGPSGLHSRRNVGLGVTRGASDSEDDLDRSERGLSVQSDTYAPSEQSNRISLFSAASSEEDSDSSGAAFDEEDERDRRSGRGRTARGSDALQLRPRKRRKKTAKELQRQVEAQATDFLAGIDLPAPEYTPLSVKARLSNALAEQTKILPLNARVDRVAIRERPPFRASTAQSDLAFESSNSRTGPNTERHDSPSVDEPATGDDDDDDAASGSGPLGARADVSEELPDYEEEEAPEAVLAPKYEDVDLLKVQAYFRKPTRAGALSRWFAIVARDVEALPEGMLYTAYREDCDQVEKLGVALPSERFFPVRDFQSTSSEKLLSTRPSFAVCAMLWTDLLDASHSERHEPVAGRGRACRCPLWTPERWSSWADEIRFLRDRHGLAMEDLVRVLDIVFGQPDHHANESGRSVLQLVYENNWIWYTHIVQLALLKTAYLELASDEMLDRLGSTLIAKREDEQIRLRALRAKADRHKGTSDYNELMLDYNFAELRSKNDQETRLELYERLCRIGAQGNSRRDIETWRKPIRPRVP